MHPLSGWQMVIDRFGGIVVTGQVLGSNYIVSVLVSGFDVDKQIIVSNEGIKYYIMTRSDDEQAEYSSLVSSLLRGAIKRISVDESSPYHNAGKVQLVRDVWYLIIKRLDHADRASLRYTSSWFHANIPVFTDRRDRDDVIDSMTTGYAGTLRCVVPVSIIHNTIQPAEAIGIIETIISGELPAVPQFFALLMMRAGMLTGPATLKSVPSRYLSSVDFAKSYIRYTLIATRGKPSSILCGILRAAVSLRDGHLWVKLVTSHSSWDWYASQYRQISATMLSNDDPDETYALIPPMLPNLFGEFVDAIMLNKSYRTASILLESGKFTDYYRADPSRMYPILNRIAIWLCRRWRMRDRTLIRMHNAWDCVLSTNDKKRLHQSLRDVLATRYGLVRHFHILSGWA